MRLLSWLAPGLVVLGACSTNNTAATSPLSVAGDWTQGARLRDSVHAQTHLHAGSFSFAQRGETFKGSGQQNGLCNAASGDYTGPLADGALFQITSGVQNGANVSFKSNMCTYDGTVSADGLHMAGTATCSYTVQGTRFDWSGEWLADRVR